MRLIISYPIYRISGSISTTRAWPRNVWERRYANYRSCVYRVPQKGVARDTRRERGEREVLRPNCSLVRIHMAELVRPIQNQKKKKKKKEIIMSIDAPSSLSYFLSYFLWYLLHIKKHVRKYFITHVLRTQVCRS